MLINFLDILNKRKRGIRNNNRQHKVGQVYNVY